MKQLITLILTLTIFSTFIVDHIMYLDEIEVVEWFDGDIDSDGEEEKLKVEDKLFVEYLSFRKKENLSGNAKLDIWFLHALASRHSEILTPPPELA